MTYSTIKDVGETLIKLLWDNMKDDPQITSIIESEGQITLDSPEEIEADKKLSLFLFNIRENVFLKNQDMQKTDSKLKYPPIYLDLFYLVTPNTQKRENDHVVLGKVMQIFNDNAILSGSVFKGGLEGYEEELRLILTPLTLDDVQKIWMSLKDSQPFKISICYEVTPVKIESTREIEVSPVLRKDLDYYQIRVER